MKYVTKVVSTVALGALLLAGCSFSASTAQLGKIEICDKTATSGCENPSTTFGTDVKTFYSAVDVNYALSDTVVRGEWWHMADEPYVIDEVTYTTKENENLIFFNLTAAGGGTFPAGEYQFKAYLNAATTPKTVDFKVQ